MGTEGARDPVDPAVFTDDGPLRIEVVHILGPVFNGRIGQLCIVADEEFDAAGVEVGYVVLRSRTAFDEVDLGPFFDMIIVCSNWPAPGALRRK